MLHVCSTPSSGSLLGVVEEIKMQRYQIQHLQTLFPPPVSNSSSPLKAVKAMVTGVLQTRPLHQLSLAAAGLDAKTCMQTKRKRGGAGESWSPLRQAGRAPPAALRREGGFISQVQP